MNARGAGRPAAEIRQFLIAGIARMTGIPADRVDSSVPIADTGVDSVRALELIGETEQWLGVELPDTLPWTHPTVDQIADHLAGGPDQDVTAAPAEQPGRVDEPIAIVGLACRFPGAADKDQFWRLVCDGVDAISEVPAQRWPADEFYHPIAGAPGRMTTRHGGFVAGVDRFDAGFFGITAAEAIRMDPQQRLFLETSWLALEDAAIPFGALAGSDTGVFVGVYAADYAMRLMHPDRIDAHYGMGNSLSLVANRVSHLLDLRGPSLAIATVCSSSLVALHLACDSLRRGESTLAVAGGVNLVLEPHTNIWFAQIDALAPDGRCKSFSTRADGLVRSDGVGAVVLKPLSAAIRDSDRIYAVVRGSAMRHNGRSNGIAAPSGPGQVAVLRAALASAGADPAEVDYIEAHGTGTPIGDRIEIDALRTVFAGRRPHGRPCVLGTVKSNIGHTESAAGIAGVIKTALAMWHGRIPPHLHAEPPHPALAAAGLRIPTAAEPWPAVDRPWLAGVSAFGMGGTDAHVLLQQAAPAPARPASGEPPVGHAHLLTVSAASQEALRTLADRYRQRLAELDDQELADACHTVNVGRARLRYRAAVIGDSVDEIRAGLRALAAGDTAPGVLTGPADGGTSRIGYWLPAGTDESAESAQLAARWRSWGAQPAVTAGAEPAATFAEHGCRFVLEFTTTAVLRDTEDGTKLDTGTSWYSTLLALGTLYVYGAAVRWEAVDTRHPARRVDMPTYPFEQRRYWFDRTPGTNPVVADSA